MKLLSRFRGILTGWIKSVGDHRSNFKTFLLLGAFVVFNVAYSSFAENVTRGIEFAKVGDLALKLDLHLPDKQTAPLIVYVHGGAWRGGVRGQRTLRRVPERRFCHCKRRLPALDAGAVPGAGA